MFVYYVHIGGDEFLVIVRGEDLSNFEETMKHFDDTMLYSIVNYEGVDLIFSVARGYSHYKKETVTKTFSKEQTLRCTSIRKCSKKNMV